MQFKVVSLNLWTGGRLMPAVIKFLHQIDAEVVMLQEVYDAHESTLPENYRTMEVLQAQLAYKYDQFARAYTEDKDGYELPHGNAIFSKFPIVSSQIILMTESTRSTYQDIPEHWPILPAPLQQALLAVKGRQVNFYNMHGVWDLEGDNYSPQRQQMTQAILKAVKGKPNVVLAGDSNAKSSNQAMRDLEKTLKPVFDDSLKTTFNMWRKTNPGYASAAVDLMYVSPSVEVISYEVPNVDVSDHLPLVVTLRID